MALTESPGPVACPGCLTAPDARSGAQAARGTAPATLSFTLPTIHCAACISKIERGLAQVPGVRQVRVNLTRKRVSLAAAPSVTAEAIVAEIAALGYEAHALDAMTLGAAESDATARDLTMRLGVAGFAMMNIMLLSVAVWSGASDATLGLFHWLSAVIAVPTVAFSGRPFFVSALGALRVRRLNMDVPISLGILLATGLSLFETLNGGTEAYFDAAVSLTFFLLAGRTLDQRMRGLARSAAAELAALEVTGALRVGPDGVVSVPVTELRLGDSVLVQTGARVPVDGEVLSGESEIDASFLSGESAPIMVRAGAMLRAGQINLTGPLTMSVGAVGNDTYLHALSDLIGVAETAKSRYRSLADRATAIYAPAVHLLALSAFITWMWLTGGDVRHALNIAVALLIITCPCALGLAVPAVSTVASGRLFRQGLLVKHATALERLAEVDGVVFDKTGTLTTGKPRLANEAGIPAQALAIAAALAQGSAHPRSAAILAACTTPLPPLTKVREVPGFGVEGYLDGKLARLGRPDWQDQGSGTVLSLDGDIIAEFEFDENLRPGAAELVAACQKAGLPVTLLSGDTEANVRGIADKLGIADWQANVLPDQKASYLQMLRTQGRRVLMVGDGLNDTAALAMAHASIAPASALEATRVAADVVLVANDLARIEVALRIARVARRRILENFGVAVLYNMIAVPLAFAGFVTPLVAAVAMSSSSIVVSLNALRAK